MTSNRFQLIIYIPTFNRLEKLKNCLDVITREIVGLEDKVLIYVSNNGSTDGTKKYLQALDYKWLHIRHNKENIGIILNILHCFDLPIKSEFVWSIGDDDYLMPGSISGVLSLIKEYPAADYIFCNSKACSTQQSAEIMRNYFETGLVNDGVLKSRKYIGTALVDFEQLIDPDIADTLLGELMVSCFRQSSVPFDTHEVINLHEDTVNWKSIDFETAGKLHFPQSLPFLNWFNGKTKAVYCDTPRTFNFWGSAEWLGDYDYAFPIGILFLILQYKEHGFISDEKFIKLLDYYYSIMRDSLARQIYGQSTARPFNSRIKAKMFEILFLYMNKLPIPIGAKPVNSSKENIEIVHLNAKNNSISAPLTSVIVLTYNQLAYTKQCLESIKAHTPEPHELIIVDNGSTDGTLIYLQDYISNHENVKVIANKENKGFAAGNNQGLALAEGEYILLLNNDTIVTEGWLSKMLGVFNRYPEIGIVGPVSNYVSGPQLLKNVSYKSINEMHQFAKELAKKHEEQIEKNYRVVGFCLLARRSVFDRIGGLDEKFGSGNFEDDDFCIRAAMAGFEAAIAKDVFIHHSGSQTFKGEKIDYGKSMERNWKVLKKKWDLPSDLTMNLPYTISFKSRELSEYYIPISIELKLGNHKLEQNGKWRQDYGQALPSSRVYAGFIREDEDMESIQSLLSRYSKNIVVSSVWQNIEDLNKKLENNEFLLLLSPDVILTKRWFDNLFAIADSDKTIAAVGPTVNSAPAPQRINKNYKSLKKELQKFAMKRKQQFKNSWNEVPYLGSFCLLLKTEPVRKTGVLNENFSLQEALWDLFNRLRTNGYKLACAKGVYVHHEELTPDEGAEYDSWYELDKQLIEGENLFNIGELEKAGEIFQDILAKNSNQSNAHCDLACVLWQTERLDEAVQEISIAFQISPNDKDIAWNYGQILKAAGRDDEANDAYGMYLEKYPAASEFSHELNQWKKQPDLAKNAEADHKKELDELFVKGEKLFNKQDYDEAEKIFLKILKNDPDYHRARNDLACVLWQTNRMEEAAEEFRKAMELAPDDRDIVWNSGQFLSSIGFVNETKGIYSSYLKRHPEEQEMEEALVKMNEAPAEEVLETL